MKILVAEDDCTSRIILESIISKWSFQVSCAEDGAKAWTILQKDDCPPLAIIDWEMPELDGLELCRKVKALQRENPVYIILLTGRDSKSDIVTGLDAGADDYITKPFDNNELRARINVAVRLLETQQSLKIKVSELKSALDHVKTLQGILPICMHCHSIRRDKAAWQRLEAYLEEHSHAQFSHSICPSCLATHYPDFIDDDTSLDETSD